MLAFRFPCFCFSLLTVLSLHFGPTYRQDEIESRISGYLKMDPAWDSTIYLSYIPTFEDMYIMSNEMIIAKASVKRHGYFEFDISFLPTEDGLYRLHITKKGDTPASLIIGGKDENHLFFIANQQSNFELRNQSVHPPFKNVTFINSDQNVAFQLISDLVHQADSTASESSAAKRKLIEDRLNENLLLIADTTENLLVSLYAIYKSRFQSDQSANLEYYQAYLQKRGSQTNAYLKSFSKQIPVESSEDNTLVVGFIAAGTCVAIGFLIGHRRRKTNSNVEKLSVQERRVLELLKKGATNQEISNQYNIEVSTVKSHVSSILSKLKVKSRKEIINIE